MNKPNVEVLPCQSDDTGWIKFRNEPPSKIHESISGSWSKTDLSSVTGALLWFAGTSIRLDTEDGTPGEFWQSDDYLCVVGENNPAILKRRLQVKVDDGWFCVEISRDGSVEFHLNEKRI